MSRIPTRVLVIRAGQLGDTVCASSIIEPLRHMFGTDVVVDWVAKAGIGRIFSSDPRIHRIFELDSRRAPFPFNAGKRAIVGVSWRQPYDLAVNMELGPMFNTVMRLVRAKRKIGMPFRHFTEPAENHAVENLRLIYRSFMDEHSLRLAEPNLIGTPEQSVRERYPLADRYVVLVPSNSHHQLPPEKNYRNWPVQHWRRLIAQLAKKERQVVIVGGASEAEYFEHLKPWPDNVLDLVGKTAFPDLVGVLAHADAVVTTDTGPAHIAGAVGVPVLTLIGPTNPKRTAPYNTEHNAVRIISADLPCSPCYHTQRFAECPKNQCMHDIAPDAIIQALDAI
ncbi:MAG: glycosyltransferase family 9 protein [Pseudomonadota bacterium]|nr:MAG: glycosyltransferase family 9 protein [Pseudomonadota bacterium]